MSKYIDADKLIAWCNETYQAQSTVQGKAYINAFLTKVLSCPTADVVEVVRCKDCRHWNSSRYDAILESAWGECRKSFEDYHCCETTENDYCSYGERKENER